MGDAYPLLDKGLYLEQVGSPIVVVFPLHSHEQLQAARGNHFLLPGQERHQFDLRLSGHLASELDCPLCQSDQVWSELCKICSTY